MFPTAKEMMERMWQHSNHSVYAVVHKDFSEEPKGTILTWALTPELAEDRKNLFLRSYHETQNYHLEVIRIDKPTGENNDN